LVENSAVVGVHQLEGTWEAERPVLRRMSVAQSQESQRRLATRWRKAGTGSRLHSRVLAPAAGGGRKGDFNGILGHARPKQQNALRQVVELGQVVGLFDFRPCWLTNPNTASPDFPAREQSFDLVFSTKPRKCPIEQAFPPSTGRTGLSSPGDEKQLPPTSFFPSRDSASAMEPAGEAKNRPTVERDVKTAAQRRKSRCGTVRHRSARSLEAAARQCLLNIHYRSGSDADFIFQPRVLLGRLQNAAFRHQKFPTHRLSLIEVEGNLRERNRTWPRHTGRPVSC